MTSGTTLAAALWPARRETSLLREGALAVFGTLLLIAASRVQVPFWPVPMTMTTLAVMLIGATYGLRLATATLGLFLLQGALGLPVFAGGGGLAYMAGPTGGYLLGYLLAAALLGAAADRGWTRRLPLLLGALVAAELVLFAAGYVWLAMLIGPDKAMAGGVLPFLPGDALKIALAAGLVLAGWRAAPRVG
jgi:biotin transport system substrate-specific component